MKDFSSWGVRIRKFPEYNYHAVWSNLKTLRLGTGQASALPPDKSEFYDIAINNKCGFGCPWCYTDAKNNGKNFTCISDKAKFFFGKMSENDRPWQAAIGSLGEPTEHPGLTRFLKTLFELKIVPNYTTNGMLIAENSDWSEQILEATRNYVGGVAVSANTWSKKVNEIWRIAFDKLFNYGDTKINLHYIISDKRSVDEFINIYKEYKDVCYYFVLLPLMNSGRSAKQYTKEAFNYLLEQDFDTSKIAFGAHFYDLLKEQDKVKYWLYPPESFSKNLILDDIITITPSSFDLTPLIEIPYA